MSKSRSNRPSRNAEALKALDEMIRTLGEYRTRLARVQAVIAEQRQKEQRDRVSAKGKAKPAVSRVRQAVSKPRRSRRP